MKRNAHNWRQIAGLSIEALVVVADFRQVFKCSRLSPRRSVGRVGTS